MQKNGKRVINRVRLSWFTCELHYRSWGRTCWLREQGETSPLPVFHSCISSRCTVRPLTCALWTGLWRGSCTFLFVPHFNTNNRAWPFLHLLFKIVPIHHSNFFPRLQCLVIPHLTCPNSPALFYPFPCPHFLPFQILSIYAIQAPLSAQDWRVYWPPSLLHPSSSACKKQIKSSTQLGKLFISVSIKVTGILADPKMKPNRRQ